MKQKQILYVLLRYKGFATVFLIPRQKLLEQSLTYLVEHS